jgi:hypothetical protein
VVVGGPPGLRLRAQRQRLATSGPFSSYLCVSLGATECSFGAVFFTHVTADCRLGRLIFWGLLGRGSREVTAVTDLGAFHARVRRLPRALRTVTPATPRWARLFAPVAAFTLAIPRRARSSAVVISGRREARHALRLPPASAQCGYDDFLFD